ncbi:MAG: porin [Rubrivivax sp.]|nr:porin [Rubrivivax sp.]
MAVLLLALTALPAGAQFERLVDEIEWKRLDLRPRPALLRERGVRVYGRLDLAAIRTGGRNWLGHPDVPSYLGVQGDQPVGGGWRMRFEFEQGFDATSEPGTAAGTQAPASDCGAWFDRACWLQLEHASGASVVAGRYLQPAYQVAALADPWLGAGGATAQPLRYPAPHEGGRPPRIRSSQALTLRSPDWEGHRVEVMRTHPDPDRPGPEVGAAWRYERGAWVLGAGWQRWDAGHDALPVSAAVRLGWWRLHLGATWGHHAGRRYHGSVLGLVSEGRSGARPLRWRFSVAEGRLDGERRRGKLALGAEKPLGRNVLLYGNAAWSRQPQTGGWTVELGLRQEFSL